MRSQHVADTSPCCDLLLGVWSMQPSVKAQQVPHVICYCKNCVFRQQLHHRQCTDDKLCSGRVCEAQEASGCPNCAIMAM